MNWRKNSAEMETRLKNCLMKLPKKSGIYIFKNEDGDCLYIGKAKNIYKRVSSYFSKQDTRWTVNFLLKEASNIDFITTSSEKEALVLENNLIKKYKPKYNIDLKDDKTFFTLAIDKDKPFPRIRWMRKVDYKNFKKQYLIGPFESSSKLKEALKYILKVTPLRTCSDASFKNRKRPCVRYEIGKCCAPCCGFVSKEKYDEYVKKFVSIMKGNNANLLEKLKNEIKDSSAKLEFEKAKRLYEQLKSLEQIAERQVAVLNKKVDVDIVGIAENKEKCAVLFQIFHIRNGILSSESTSFFSGKINDIKDVAELFLFNLYSEKLLPPKEIIVPIKINKDVLQDEISKKIGMDVKIKTPKKGDLKKLLDMALKNAEEKISDRQDEYLKIERLKKIMMEKLKLHKKPDCIECFDVSSIQGEDVVASKVCFIDFKPYKSLYRRYSFCLKEKNDDYFNLFTAVKNRLEKNNDKPDLIVLDGGFGHLNSVLEGLKKEGINIDCDIISIAKKRGKRYKSSDEVFIPGRRNPVKFKNYDEKEVLYKLMAIRDEAHRFAVSYHRLKRKKRYFDGKSSNL